MIASRGPLLVSLICSFRVSSVQLSEGIGWMENFEMVPSKDESPDRGDDCSSELVIDGTGFRSNSSASE